MLDDAPPPIVFIQLEEGADELLDDFLCNPGRAHGGFDALVGDCVGLPDNGRCLLGRLLCLRDILRPSEERYPLVEAHVPEVLLREGIDDFPHTCRRALCVDGGVICIEEGVVAAHELFCNLGTKPVVRDSL